MYVQVAYLLPEQNTIDREVDYMTTIDDNYPKLLVTLDEYKTGSIKGVRILHARDFPFQEW